MKKILLSVAALALSFGVFAQITNAYPNPASDVLTVELYVDNASKIELIDNSNKVVAEQNVSVGPNTVKFNVTELKNGFYLVLVKSEGGVEIEIVLVGDQIY